MDKVCAALLPDRAVLRLGGSESRHFLQGLISNDVGKLSPEHALYAALLTPQGKYLFDFMLLEHDGAILLDGERQRIDELRQRLLMYRLRARVEIASAEPEVEVAAIFGEGASLRLGLADTPGATAVRGELVVAVDPRLPALGLRAVGPAASLRALLEEHGIESVEASVYDRHRMRLGVPDGSRDLEVQKSILLEANFEELNGVDFKKGCYVGQELTARTKHRGLVKRRLLPVEIEGKPPEAGAVIRLGDKEVGELRSHEDRFGLAMLRLDRLEEAVHGGRLTAGDAEIRVRWPDWLPLRA